MGYNKFVINGATKFDLTADTVDAAHLYTGYTAHGPDGETVTGTLAPDMVLISSSEFTDSCDSTTAAAATTIALGSSAYTANGVLFVRIRDKAGKRNGYYYGTDSFLYNFKAATGATTTVTYSSAAVGSLTMTYRVTDAGVLTPYCTYTGYGLYPYSLSNAGALVLRHRYSESYSLTIDGTYVIEVYLVKGPFESWYGA